MKNKHPLSISFLAFLTIHLHSQPISFTPNTNALATINGASIEDCAVDMNGDFLDDIVRVTGDALHIDYQQTDGSFAHQTFTVPMQNSPSWSICAGDIDGNGFNDLLFGSGSNVSFMVANANGTNYTEQYESEYIFSQRSTFSDIDNDGHLDAFVCHDIDQSHPYRNDGNGNMLLDQSLIVTDDSRGNYSAIWVDYDNDGDSDLYISKCVLGSTPTDPDRRNRMYRNNSDGTFTEVSADINMDDIAQSWTTVFQDFDNDGDFDAFVVNHDFANRFMRNDNGVFTDIIGSTLIPANALGSWEGAGADFNNDGFVDILGQFNQPLFINNGDLTFTAQNNSFSSGGIGDFNNDGFLDVISGNVIHYNNGNDNNWVKINTQGLVSNKNAIGARVEIHGDWGIQIREVRSGESFSPMSTLTTHFGIGQATSIDQIVIKWPSGIITTIDNPGINTTHNIPEAECFLAPSEIVVDGATVLCEGQSTILTAPAGFDNYIWSNGATTQSITVTQNGTYTVSLLDATGCVSLSNSIPISVTEEINPQIEILGEDIFCLGETTTLSALNGDNPLWSNGMSGQNIEVTESGNYYVQVDALCSEGQITSPEVAITVLDATEPLVSDVELTAPGPATFTAVGAHLEWYAEATGGAPIATGPEYTLLQVDMSETVFVQAHIIDGGELQDGGKQGFDGAGGLPSSGAYSWFTTWEPFTILQVTVQVPDNAPSGVRTVQLVDFSNNTLTSADFDLAPGVHVLDLNFEVPVGLNFSLRCPQNNLFRNSGGVSYPYPIGDVGELTNTPFGLQYYYYFYDWVIEKKKVVCPSERVSATASVIISATDDLDGVLSALAISPNPANDFISIDFEAAAQQELSIRLLDATGRMVRDLPAFAVVVGKNQRLLEVRDLPGGLYFLEIRVDGKVGAWKVVVE